jgi:outer membrane protein assembly factor BamB
MKELYYKTKLSTIALILVLTVSATLVALPAATAQEIPTKTTYAFIGAVPNPVGVNQPVLLHVGITDYFDSAEKGWENLSVSVIDPEGIESTIEPIRTDATGGTGVLFTPTKVGTYTLQTHFPTQMASMTPFFSPFPITRTFLASDSDILELEVQEEPLPYYPGHSLPDEYWTRPIDSQLREWHKISGSWLIAEVFMSGMAPSKFAPYNDDAPDTAHILWTRPIGGSLGGLAGGQVGEHSMEAGDAYEGKFQASIIVNGILYYNKYEPLGWNSLSTTTPKQEVVAVDLHTGEELWTKIFLDNRTIAFAQLFYWDSYNYHGVFAYLWITTGGGMFGDPATWHAFDPLTGEWEYSMTNVPSGNTIFGPKGEIYIYTVDLTNGWMTQWNSSRAGCLAGSWGNTVRGRTIDATAGYDWNMTIPTGLPGSVQAAFFGDRVIGASVTQEEVTVWGLSLEAGNEGDELFNNTWEAPSQWATGNQSISWVAASIEDKVGVLWTPETRKYYGFSLEDGDYLWVTEESEHYLNFHVGTVPAIAYGRLFSSGVSGIVYCYNLTTGERLWTYEAADHWKEILWANNWWSRIQFITDGKIYMGHEEHSVIDPKPRGAPYYCLDVEDGSVVWRINGAFRQTHWGGRSIIGDSIIATQSTYDQQIYAIGKGASATTVSIQNDVVSLGSSVMIKGTVMDVSPGTEDTALQIRFPNGVPAISDDDMSEWMKYVYMQFKIPADATGVDVKLEAIDPNGDYAYIGTATTDTSGNYGFAWKPDMEGQYLIMATFYGSGGYYGSTTTTYLKVDPAPEELDIPTADEIAAETISRLPAYPDVPSATAVAQETISQLPAYPEMPEIPEIPAYLTIDLVIIVAVAIAIIIGIVSYLALKKQK